MYRIYGIGKYRRVVYTYVTCAGDMDLDEVITTAKTILRDFNNVVYVVVVEGEYTIMPRDQIYFDLNFVWFGTKNDALPTNDTEENPDHDKGA